MSAEKTKRFFASLGKLSLTAALCGAIGGGTFVGVTKLVDGNENKEAQTAAVEAPAREAEPDEGGKADAQEEDKRLVSSSADDRVEEVAPSGSSVSEVAKAAMPSIVSVTVKTQGEYTDMFGRSTGQMYESEGAGSGILVAQENGYLYIVTNNHVVAGATEVSAEFIDGEEADAEVLGTDSKNDLAVIRIPDEDLKAETKDAVRLATIGDSDALSVGDEVIAIGNALGYGQSVTTGIVSALNREVAGQDPTTGQAVSQKLIQTDAAINPGNSGGALLNTKGEVVGINSSKYADTTVEGMCFAIPVNAAKEIVTAIIQGTYEELQKSAGYLGISCIDVTSDVSKNYNMPEGVYIANIAENSAAKKAGLMEGQIITEFNGEKVTSSAALSEMIGSLKGGDEATLKVMTANQGTYEEETITVTLGNRGDYEETEKTDEKEEAPEMEKPETAEPEYPGGSFYEGNGMEGFEDFFGRFFGR
ncbi:MAG: trypsin-like peptidase domain-containing protein [Lachnospiraceae bacterium]|nr:trypsin-like peptidase domain-containing protein [Lachnospiraceae bacterium]